MGAASQVLDYLDIDSFDDVGIVRPCRVPLNVWTTYCESFGHTRDGKLPPLSRPCVRLPQVGKYPLGAGVQEKGEGVVPEPTLTIHEQDQRQVRSRQRNFQFDRHVVRDGAIPGEVARSGGRAMSSRPKC